MIKRHLIRLQYVPLLAVCVGTASASLIGVVSGNFRLTGMDASTYYYPKPISLVTTNGAIDGSIVTYSNLGPFYYPGDTVDPGLTFGMGYDMVGPTDLKLSVPDPMWTNPYTDVLYGQIQTTPALFKVPDFPDVIPDTPWSYVGSFIFQMHFEKYGSPGRSPMLGEWDFAGIGTVTLNFSAADSPYPFMAKTYLLSADYAFGSSAIPEPATGVPFLFAMLIGALLFHSTSSRNRRTARPR